MRRQLAALFALIAVGVISLGASGAAIAQDDMSAAPHPAHIHSGSCETLGDVVYPLNDIGADFMMDGTPMAMDAMGASTAIPVLASVTTVDAALADIVAAEHAINVHQDSENMGVYVACGDIGGMMMGTSDLAIGLGEMNESGLSGVAWLRDNGDGTTTVSVFLIQSGMGGMATPEA